MEEKIKVYWAKDAKAFHDGLNDGYELHSDPMNRDGDYVDWDASEYIGRLIKEAQHYEALFDRFAGVGIYMSDTDKFWLKGILSRIIKKAKLAKN